MLQPKKVLLVYVKEEKSNSDFIDIGYDSETIFALKDAISKSFGVASEKLKIFKLVNGEKKSVSNDTAVGLLKTEEELIFERT